MCAPISEELSTTAKMWIGPTLCPFNCEAQTEPNHAVLNRSDRSHLTWNRAGHVTVFMVSRWSTCTLVAPLEHLLGSMAVLALVIEFRSQTLIESEGSNHCKGRGFHIRKKSEISPPDWFVDARINHDILYVKMHDRTQIASQNSNEGSSLPCRIQDHVKCCRLSSVIISRKRTDTVPTWFYEAVSSLPDLSTWPLPNYRI